MLSQWSNKCWQFDSGSSDFSKSSLGICKFMVHILSKPGLKNFKHYFANTWDECNCVAVWTFFGIAFFEIEMKTEFLQSCGHCWVFQICCHIECSPFTALSFRIWKSSTGIPSPPLKMLSCRFPLMAQWLRIHLAMQGTLIQSLVQEDPICPELPLSQGTATSEPMFWSLRAATTKAHTP